ncbi:RNA polymerase sigma factor [Streptacidiphilus sp. N1-12]|uniref:RNA polymerase sigma factor n=2 Tax=Streptacidiphilus alkalitolerans TaxID=3342712 RepID=A0ABV6W9F4_9ACTN
MIDEDELAQLVESAQSGDRESLERLLARLRPTVMRRCARFLPHHADAEEAAQDALLSISTHLHEYSGRGSFLGWVTVIASNAARSTYRSMRRRAQDSYAVVPEGVDPRTTSVIAGTRLDLMESLAALEQRHPALVTSFVLRDLGDLTYVQIAEITDAPLGTVKDRIHQARRFMRERLSGG